MLANNDKSGIKMEQIFAQAREALDVALSQKEMEEKKIRLLLE